MYLFFRKDGSARQVNDNISVCDVVALSCGLLQIFRFHKQKGLFQRLVKDEEKLVWIPVLDAEIFADADSRLHH